MSYEPCQNYLNVPRGWSIFRGSAAVRSKTSFGFIRKKLFEIEEGLITYQRSL
jgi:hypothetical protein